MSHAVHLALNLTVNAVLPFAFALLFVAGLVWLFRVPPSRARLLLLALPLVKLVWDVGRGLPLSSYLFAYEGGLVRDSGSLVVGLGAGAPFRVVVQVLARAIVGVQSFGLSAGDLAIIGCDHLSPWCATLIVAALLGVAAVLLARRLVGWARFSRVRRDARRRALRAAPIRLGSRRVDVYVSSDERLGAVPFAGGLLRPYVCFPARAYHALSPAERYATLEHELAHLAELHLAVLAPSQILGDLFWFVPGVRWLVRRLAREAEVVADQRAVSAGVGTCELASALVRAAEASRSTRLPQWVQAFVRAGRPHGVRGRVRRLLTPPRAPMARFGWRSAAVRWVVCLAAVQTVLSATVLGNL